MFNRFDSSSEILRCSFPIFTRFCFIKAFSFCHSHFLFFFYLCLLYKSCLYYLYFTCSFEVILFASELNYFLLDIKTNLQAFACFYKAFLLNFLPQPSGHITSRFSSSFADYSASYSCIGLSWLRTFWDYFFYIFGCGGGSSTFFTYSFLATTGSYLFIYYFGGSFAINIRFWIGILGG